MEVQTKLGSLSMALCLIFSDVVFKILKNIIGKRGNKGLDYRYATVTLRELEHNTQRTTLTICLAFFRKKKESDRHNRPFSNLFLN